MRRILLGYVALIIALDLFLELVLVLPGGALVNPLWPPVLLSLGAIVGPFTAFSGDPSWPWPLTAFGLSAAMGPTGLRFRRHWWGQWLAALGLTSWSFTGVVLLGASY